MTDDIVTRLRKEHAYSNDVGDFEIAKLVNEAADEIERLRKMVGQTVTTIIFDEEYRA